MQTSIGFLFRPQNYFLSRSTQRLPDQPVGLSTVEKGHLDITLEDGSSKRINVTRAHLEEDAGKSLHEDFHGQTGIDLNRAGTPLLEIVSEPELRSAKGKPLRIPEKAARHRDLSGHIRWGHVTRLHALRLQRFAASARTKSSAREPKSRTSTPSAL